MQRSVVFFLLGGIVLGSIGFAAGYRTHPSAPKEDTNPACNTIYQHLDEELRCKKDHFVISKGSYLELRTGLTRYIEQLQQDNTIDSAAVFFRDLKDGPTFGINASEPYIPASLLKGPLLITLLRLSEENPTFLEQKLLYNTKDPLPPQTFLPKEALTVGQEYTMDTLMTQMIMYSDNTAYLALYEFLEQSHNIGELLETYHELGLILPKERLEASLTVKNYASLFRILYSAAYLSRASSEKALTLMTKSTYMDGLVAGVPENITIAHKFGERFDENGPLKELHDCGIVYFPDNPYTLCVMTRGTDFSKLTTIIKTISQRVYEEVKSRANKTP